MSFSGMPLYHEQIIAGLSPAECPSLKGV